MTLAVAIAAWLALSPFVAIATGKVLARGGAS